MKYSNNSINILVAIQYKGIGKSWIISNWHKNMIEEDIVALLNNKLKTTLNEFRYKKQQVIEKIEQLSSHANGIVAWLDDEYPHCRGNITRSDYPVALFYRGDISLLSRNNMNVAVIGVLQPQESIIVREKKMVSALLKQDYTIVSGLALGCDSVAHEQALAEQGKTIAILPSTLQNILPTHNINLANKIVASGGLLITEYYEEPRNQYELRGRYPERDRLQAIFSDAIILTASYDINNDGNDSGSRLAMEYARKYNIPRYVMYNKQTDGNNSQFDLNRRILAEGDSKLLTSGIINDMVISNKSSQLCQQLNIFL